jgi:hypothetical protein
MNEEFEDAKGAIRIRISKKNRQHNDQKKKDKRTNNDLQNIQNTAAKTNTIQKTYTYSIKINQVMLANHSSWQSTF